jgi:hypothetical protein
MSRTKGAQGKHKKEKRVKKKKRGDDQVNNTNINRKNKL